MCEEGFADKEVDTAADVSKGSVVRSFNEC